MLADALEVAATGMEVEEQHLLQLRPILVFHPPYQVVVDMPGHPEPAMKPKGVIPMHGGCLEGLGNHPFLVLGPVHFGYPPCLDLPEPRPEGSAIT